MFVRPLEADVSNIQKETLEYFRPIYWERLDRQRFNKHIIQESIPSLKLLLDDLNLDFDYCSVISKGPNKNMLISKFVDSDQYNLLIPIRNCRNAVLQYFTAVKKQSLYGYSIAQDKWNLWSYREAELQETHSLNSPIFYNIKQPHTVHVSPYSKIPVILLDIVLTENHD